MAGETTRHRNLKRAALAWAQLNGYPIAGLEIRAPVSNYRVDVAAARPAAKDETSGLATVFECKQARPDFLKDRHAVDDTLQRFAELHARKRRLEHRLGIHLPSLRRGDALFPDYESVDLSAVRHATYQGVVRELDQLQRRIYGKTKFDRMVRWGCANLFYLVAPAEIMTEAELPTAWGLLCPPEDGPLDVRAAPVAELTLTVIRQPCFVETTEDRGLDYIQRIARSATRFFNEAEGIDGESIHEALYRPRHRGGNKAAR